MDDDNSILPGPKRTPWNKGKLIGAKPPLLARHVWSIRTKLQIERHPRVCASKGSGQRQCQLTRGHALTTLLEVDDAAKFPLMIGMPQGRDGETPRMSLAAQPGR